jgi:1-deoxy-D-xylulose-5-phosphate synthase
VFTDWQKPFNNVEIGKGEKLCDGSDIAILSIGHPGNFVLSAIESLTEEERAKVAHYNMIFVKPVDEDILHHVGQNFKKVITIEDGTVVGGFGSAVIEFFSDNNYNTNVERLGVPDRWIEHGKPDELHKLCGFDSLSIVQKIKELLN